MPFGLILNARDIATLRIILNNEVLFNDPCSLLCLFKHVIQSLNYYWTKTIPLLILQGDSFRKDYYGYSVDSTPDYMFGYPFGGVWSGPGIIDSSVGTFDPSVAGVGIHELQYVTPNCYYVGRMEIEVKAAPNVALQNPLKCNHL